jgi:hypothetical protein
MVVIPEERQVRIQSMGKVQLRITSYKLGSEYACMVDNVDPGATIARARSDTREGAEAEALGHAMAAIERR